MKKGARGPYLGTVLPVEKEEEVELRDVVDQELVEAILELVAGLKKRIQPNETAAR